MIRLSEFEIKSIKTSFDKYFKSGSIYLFGSRVDITKRGGDIDLYIDTLDKDQLIDKKINFLIDVKSKIGEQKIDVVISKDKTRKIEQEALSKGVKLSIENTRRDKILNECDRHLQRLEFAEEQLKSIFPLDEQKYLKLTEENMQSIDQFLYRFSKLQDTIGEKLIKIIFSLYEENIVKFTFIDMLNTLEKREILSVKDWQQLRSIRNELSHNYDDDPLNSSIIINKIYDKKYVLNKIYQNIKKTLIENETR